MRVLRALFGPSREAMWRQLCREIGADYIEGGLFKTDAVQARVGDWIITLDILTESTGKSSTTYTRMRAPYVNSDQLRFRIYRKGFFTELGKWFGMQDIEVGDPRFDSAFVIQGTSEAAIGEFFSNPRIQNLLAAQPKVHLEVKNDEGWFGPSFPDGVDELYFQAVGVIKDVDRLKRLFDLFAETLNHLCHVSSDYQDDVELLIERVLAPGGKVAGNLVLWEGDPPRIEAAGQLARLKDPQAVRPLMSVLDDKDPLLVAKAVWALGEIGDQTAVSALFPLLGDGEVVQGESFSERAARSLRQLGEADRVEAFDRALSGDVEPLKQVVGEYRPQLCEALVVTLSQADDDSIRHAAVALSSLGAVEALPTLRVVERRFSKDHPTRAACQRAITELEARGSLPRPAALEKPGVETLPRAVDEPVAGSGTLPKAAEDQPGED